MLSDVLQYAIAEIDRHLVDYPHVYQQDERLHEHIKELQLRIVLLLAELEQKAVKT